MRFTIKDDASKSLCNSCVHSHILRTFEADEKPITICTLMGRGMVAIKSCSKFTSIAEAGVIPAWMMHLALPVRNDKKESKTGFRGVGQVNVFDHEPETHEYGEF